MNVRIGYATTDLEREAAYRLRYDVYVREMRMFGNVADHAGGRLVDDHDATGRLIVAEVDGEIVGTVRLNWGGDAPPSAEHVQTYGLQQFLAELPPAKIVAVTRLVVRPAHRGSRLILDLVRACGVFARDHQTTAQFCDCQPHLVALYVGMGFRPYTVAFNDPQFGIMVPLVLVADSEYLTSIRSPLADLFRDWEEIPSLARVQALVPDLPPVRDAVGVVDGLDAELQALLDARREDAPGFFDAFDEDEVRRLVKRGHVIECSQGDVVVQRGQILRTLFVVLSGELEAVSNGAVVNTVHAGESFGEIAFLHGIPRTVALVASSARVLVLALHEVGVRKLMRDDPAIAGKLLYNLARGLALRLARRELR